MSEHHIRVFSARIGTSELFSADFFDGDYPSFEMTVDDTTPLTSIIQAAEGKLGMPSQKNDIVHLLFAGEKFVEGGAEYPAPHADVLRVVDDVGAIRWAVPEHEWDTISFGNLLDSREAGLIKGDPHSVYVIRTGQYGNGYFPMDWGPFLTKMAEIVKWAQASKDFAELGLALAAAVTVLKKHYANWRDRRATPEALVDYIVSRQNWDATDLGKRLGVSARDAKVLLKLFGFAYERRTRLYVRDKKGKTRLIYNRVRDVLEADAEDR